MKIAIGCDHGGINLKPVLVDYLKEKGYEYEDFGCFDKASTDYNEYAVKVGKAVASKSCDLGILICGTGIGMSIVANKIKGIRCGHCHDVFSAKMTRLHNDANVLAFGERVIGPGLMLEIVEAFLTTEFSNPERHIRRVEKIKALEEENFKDDNTPRCKIEIRRSGPLDTKHDVSPKTCREFYEKNKEIQGEEFLKWARCEHAVNSDSTAYTYAKVGEYIDPQTYCSKFKWQNRDYNFTQIKLISSAMSFHKLSIPLMCKLLKEAKILPSLSIEEFKFKLESEMLKMY